GWAARMPRARNLAGRARSEQAAPPTYHDLSTKRAAETAQVDHALLGQPEVAEALRHLGEVAGSDFVRGVAAVSEATVEQLQSGKVDLHWLSGAMPGIEAPPPPPPPRRGGRQQHAGPPPAPPPGKSSTGRSPLAVLSGLRKLTPKYVPALSPRFAPEANPLLASLKLRVELQLDQLRGGRCLRFLRHRREP